jgi:hypothetical protein
MLPFDTRRTDVPALAARSVSRFALGGWPPVVKRIAGIARVVEFVELPWDAFGGGASPPLFW